MSVLFGILFSLFFGFVPMFIFAWLIYLIDRFEKEPKLLLGAVFLWGAIVAAGGAFIINTFLGLGVFMVTSSEAATNLATGSVIAPIVEESLKGFAVLVVFLLFRREFDSVLDGIIYAATAALGFAATENAFYIFNYGFAENGMAGAIFLVFVRVVLVGWQHPFYTSFTGIGLAASRLSPSAVVKWIAPVVGWSAAVFTHAAHNTLAEFLPGIPGLATGTLIDWTGWFFMFLFILWAIYREQQWIARQLREEVRLGTITPAQYRVACSAWAQNASRFNALLSGQFQSTSRFYQVAAELAYKKQQRATLGEESGNSIMVDKLRAELAQLSPRVRA